MALTDAQKKTLSDLATGHTINSKVSMEDQIAALRKQIDIILAANPKITVDPDYKAFSTIVETEIGKKKTTEEVSKKGK